MHNTRGHRYKLNIILTFKNSFKYYFINRIAHIGTAYQTIILIRS